jgi:prepilin-type N-terminal cleavage/methylation domain-containing protein/prepilin-type processing-associated H-X9-DG protein
MTQTTGNYHINMIRRAFSLIELLVVVGIIAVLLALLFPALANAQRAARTVACQSNLRQLGQQLYIYAHENQGFVIPMTHDDSVPGGLRGLGTKLAPSKRWPAVVFKVKGPDPETKDPADYCPKVIICPADLDASSAHTYALSNPPGVHACKLGTSNFNGLSSSEVVLAAEKVTFRNDYYIEPSFQDFADAVSWYRHGIKRGANYLFFDSHVELRMPKDVVRGLDPWETHNDAPAQ